MRFHVGFEVELVSGKLVSLLLLTALVALAGCLVVPTYAQGPSISSQWTGSPPTIDGRFTAGEWFNLQIAIQGSAYPESYVKPTFVYFMNDNSRLYVLVDAAGDITNDLLDECLLVFGFQNRVSVEIIGLSGTRLSGTFDAAVGFYTSPNNSTVHKIYEFSIPFSFINAQPGQPLDFSSPLSGKHFASMPYDSLTTHDNVWPVGLDPDDINTYSRLRVGTQPPAPVGGAVVSVNKLSIAVPYLALLGIAATVTLAALAPWKKRDN